MDSVVGVNKIFKYCQAKAETFGYKMFGVDRENCWSGDHAESTYDDYGKSTLCTINANSQNGAGKSINRDVFVYKLE